ncbi:FecR family protein [Bradyrhizobium sp.]|uniref:FecR family protein n=1 Tax=Bradyrhizobium sp. TaxID=376 RepID=UPI002D17A5E0|nr:FecR family protein [Bradyrhizobium sp.]HMM88621.1 FecR family protein [Bradyrhizobium sp.]
MRALLHVSRAFAAAVVMATGSIAYAADGDAWTVSKSSGEVWLTGSGLQQASLKQEDVLKPGDTVRTGRNGRVLLKRGEEAIMVAPNSVVGMPAEKKEGLSTTIVQQAGSILLDVEKRNVKHFEVETPYLAAVVKGTQFRVTVNAGKTTVDVIRGQVEVADFKSGQIAQVMAGQHATAFANGKAGLSLGGTGTFSPIEHGKPRASSIERVPVPRNGLTMRHAAAGQSGKPGQHAVAHRAGHGGTRISSSIGEVRLNVHRVTHGLAREKSAVHGGSRNAARNDTVWGSSEGGANSANNGQSNSGNAAANPAGASGVSAAIAASQGGGNGNNGNGNGNGGGNGNGANGNGNGNGNAYGHAKGNGNGNGNAYGRNKS